MTPNWPAAGRPGSHRRRGSAVATAPCSASTSPRPTRAATSSSWPVRPPPPPPTPSNRFTSPHPQRPHGSLITTFGWTDRANRTLRQPQVVISRVVAGGHARGGGGGGRGLGKEGQGRGEGVRFAGVPTILVTGAAGRIGTMLRTRLARAGRTLRLLDIEAMTAGPAEEVIRASITDMAAMTAACQGADAVIHLAGVPTEGPLPPILEVHIP